MRQEGMKSMPSLYRDPRSLAREMIQHVLHRSGYNPNNVPRELEYRIYRELDRLYRHFRHEDPYRVEHEMLHFIEREVRDFFRGQSYGVQSVHILTPDPPKSVKFNDLPKENEFGELTGWRSWHVVDTNDGLRLRSAWKDTIWESGVMTSEHGKKNSHDVFKEDKKLGYYCYKRAALLYANLEDHPVAGRVEVWGSVVEHHTGYRAECMRIVQLFALEPRAQLLLPELEEFYINGYWQTDTESDGNTAEKPRA